MVNRKFLYWGVFLVATGGVLLVAQSDLVGSAVIRDALDLWPLLVIGLGVGLILRRTRLSLAGGMLAAAIPGLLLGGVVAASPDLTVGCRIVDPASYTTREGTFPSAASVRVKVACGEVTVTTVPGTGWHLETGSNGDRSPVIDATADRLSVVSDERGPHFGFRGGDAFRLSLPTAGTIDLSAEIDAGPGRFDLAGGRFGTLDLAVNAGAARVDLTGATVSRLSLHVNAGDATVRLPSGSDMTADFHANAAKLEICSPSDLGLRISDETNLGSSTFNGMVRNGSAWETPGYAAAIHHADVTITSAIASVDVNPEGGCS